MWRLTQPRLPRRSGRWWLTLGVAVVGIVLSVIGFRAAQRADVARATGVLGQRAGWQANEFQRKLLLAAENAEGVSIYIASEGEVSAARFHNYAKLAHDSEDLDSALYWSPLVRDDERDSFVAEARKDAPDYDIREIAPGDHLVPAARREMYLPQLYEETFDKAPGIAGIDLMSLPGRRADIERVRDEGVPFATTPTELLVGGERIAGFIIMWPVYGKDGPPATVEERRAAFRGMAIGRVRLDRFLPGTLADMPSVEEAIEVAVGPDQLHARPVARFDPASQGYSFDVRPAPKEDGGITVRRAFRVLDQTWVLDTHFPPAVEREFLSNEPWARLVAGLLLTAMATALAWRQTNRIASAEKQVAQQAGELGVWDDVFQNVALGIAVVDAASDTIRFANPAFAAMLGRTIDEIRGLPIREAYPEDERARVGALVNTPDDARTIAFESRYVRRDGSTYPVQDYITNVRDANGAVLYRIASAFDISERKRTAMELSESRRQADELLALLDTLQTAAPIGFGFVDRTYRIVRANAALAGFNGGLAAEHIGRPVREIVPDLWPQIEPIYRDVLENGQSHLNIAMPGPSKPGQAPGHSLASFYPVRVADTVIGIGIIIVDISQQRQMEDRLRQSQKMEAVGNLTGGIAHDFNNLLAVIIGNLDLAARLAEPHGETAELINEAVTAAMRGAELTHGLLAFARRQPLQPRSVDINTRVTGITKLLRRSLGENIEISLNLAPDIPSTTVDPAQLEAALVNLATNARDAMPSGGRLMITTGNRTLDADYAAAHAEVVPGDYVMIEVSDSGTGMTPDVVRQIFEPFFTTKGLGKGTGLGLSMVFGFMKQSGGHTSVYSELGVGTTVRLYLPRAKETPEAARGLESVAPAGGRGETVLAVEDSEALRRVLARQLKELGYRVIEANSAATALTALESETIDLLFTDIVMPGEMDGFALARRVLAAHPGIKVLLTSGFPEAKINGNLGDLSSDVRLLGKPYRKEELARLLREVLEERAA